MKAYQPDSRRTHFCFTNEEPEQIKTLIMKQLDKFAAKFEKR